MACTEFGNNGSIGNETLHNAIEVQTDHTTMRKKYQKTKTKNRTILRADGPSRYGWSVHFFFF